MARVLYEAFKMSDFQLRLILPMLYTCKYIYRNYNFMLFTLKPLRINFGGSKHKKLSLPMCKIPYLLLNERICPRLRLLHITIVPNLLNRNSINDMLNNLGKFQNLSQLTVKVKSISCLIQYLKYFPVTLTYLKVILIKYAQLYLNLKCMVIPQFQLKVLKIQSLTHSQISLSFVNSLVSSNFRASFKLNSSIVHVYQVLSQLLYLNRSSIEYLELEMLNLNQLYLVLNNNYHFSGAGYFPNLKLIKIDQTTNYPVFQILAWLSNCETIIYVNNYLSNFLVIKNTEPHHGILEVKFDLVLFQYKLKSIKKQLNLYYNV
ncbi:hypothetical protein Cantr_10141 [Candida viswanathii]|uniref:Uncharacterized protein n=1 Tax=Candida viswanathii TaxID=5486 RepID=A0A367YCM7_9ASCO|nr:hypothetical protein Cantr_10141 [Candida viswanathii]